MARQETPRKPCGCGRGFIFTSREMSKHNPIVDGKQVCMECKMDDIYLKIKGKK